MQFWFDGLRFRFEIWFVCFRTALLGPHAPDHHREPDPSQPEVGNWPHLVEEAAAGPGCPAVPFDYPPTVSELQPAGCDAARSVAWTV